MTNENRGVGMLFGSILCVISIMIQIWNEFNADLEAVWLLGFSLSFIGTILILLDIFID